MKARKKNLSRNSKKLPLLDSVAMPLGQFSRLCRHISGLEKNYLKSALLYHVYFENCTLITALVTKLLDLKVEKPSWE